MDGSKRSESIVVREMNFHQDRSGRCTGVAGRLRVSFSVQSIVVNLSA